MTGWSRLPAIRQRLEKQWSSGELLRAWRQPDRLFPLRLPLKKPTSRQLGEQFDQARSWVQHWREQEQRCNLSLEWQTVNHRQLGRNQLPRAVTFASPEEAVRLLGKLTEARRYDNLFEQVLTAVPELAPWLEQHPLTLLKLERDWPRLLAIIHWLRAHPRPGIYLRQLEIPGVHTKFIERRRRLLAQLLDLTLPAGAIEASATGARQFERRYGFASKPAPVRFRILDPDYSIHGLTDLQIPAADFARLYPALETVYVVENDITALAFPPRQSAMVIFGQGYGIDRLLAGADWLHLKQLYYWGDIDTHGFRILDRVRAVLPHTHSLLMDRATLMSHGDLWGREPDPVRQPLPHLHPDEQSLYTDLAENRLGDQLRLEQERIGFDKLNV